MLDSSRLAFSFLISRKENRSPERNRIHQIIKSEAHTGALGPDQATAHQASGFSVPCSHQAQFRARVDS